MNLNIEYRTSLPGSDGEHRAMKFLPFDILHSLFDIHYSFGSGLSGLCVKIYLSCKVKATSPCPLLKGEGESGKNNNSTRMINV
ncbi:MAG: hypothetical protein WC557_04560 [Ignavibacteriaceae bacterium]